WARVHTAPEDQTILRQALGLLDKAEAIHGLQPSKALWTDRASYLVKLAEFDQAKAARQTAERIRPSSARDHYLLATSYVRQGGADSLARATAELNLALHLDPRDYWAWVQRGICYQEQGEYSLAAGDFGTCV